MLGKLLLTAVAYLVLISLAVVLIKSIARSEGVLARLRQAAMLLGLIVLTTVFSVALSLRSGPEIDPEPERNPAPSDTVTVRYSSGTLSLSPHNTQLVAQYASFKKNCSRIEYLKGGSVNYPSKRFVIPLSPDGTYTVYKDYFHPGMCDWKMTGIALYTREGGVRFVAGAGLTDLVPGSEYRYQCSRPFRGGSSHCMHKFQGLIRPQAFISMVIEEYEQ